MAEDGSAVFQVAKKGLTEKVTFEQRTKGDEGAVLVFYCCISNYPKSSGLKQQHG